MGRKARIGLFLLMGLVVALARLIEVEVGKVRPQEETPSLAISKPSRPSAPAHQKKTHKPAALEHSRRATGPTVAVGTAAPAESAPEPKPVAPLEGAEWPKGPVYTVKKGETLGVIAQKVLGSSKLGHKLFEANAARISSPDCLKPGTKLVVPARP